MTDQSLPAIPEQAPSQLVISDGPGALLAAIVQLAKDPAIDVSKLSALMQMQERMEAREAERQFNQAMFRVQSKIKPMLREGVVNLGTNKGGYKFLRREDLDRQLRPVLEAEGFSLSFTQKAAPSGAMIVYGTARHTAGHSETAEMELPPDTGAGRSPLQARVSTISFSERVLTEMLFNVVRKGDDDDGVEGDKKYVTQDQADELVRLLKESGRQEGSFIPAMASDARSCEEVDARDFDRVKSALTEIIKNKKAKS